MPTTFRNIKNQFHSSKIMSWFLWQWL